MDTLLVYLMTFLNVFINYLVRFYLDVRTLSCVLLVRVVQFISVFSYIFI